MNARTEPQLLGRISNRHLDALEEEAFFILREVAGAFERPTLLFSGGKDSLVLLRCAEKAFGSGRIPYPLLMIDTGHNFQEVTDFRDFRAKELGAELIVRSVQRRRVGGLDERSLPVQTEPHDWPGPCRWVFRIAAGVTPEKCAATFSDFARKRVPNSDDTVSDELLDLCRAQRARTFAGAGPQRFTSTALASRTAQSVYARADASSMQRESS